MSGDEPAVRRVGSGVATRISQVSASLNWVAIGGIAFAVLTGVIAVRPSGPDGPAASSGPDHRLPVTASSETAATSFVQAAPASREPHAVDPAGEPLITGSIQVAAAQSEKRRGSRKAAESRPVEKAAEPSAAPAATPSPAAIDAVPTWSEDVIRSAREECTALMGNLTAEWSVAPPMRTTSCGAPGPITLRSVGAGKVTLAPAALTNCSTAAALTRWMDEHVQPAAVKHFGVRVAQVSIATSYDCRNRYGLAKAPLSEHALANAIDLSGFKLTNGKVVTVLGGWGPTARSLQTAPAVGAAVPKADGTAKSEGKVSAKAAQGGERMGLGAQPDGARNAARTTTRAAAPSPAKPGGQPVATNSGASNSGTSNSGTSNSGTSNSGTSNSGVRSAEAEFLHGVHAGACSVFGTVLGPEANEAHRDHFHLDMKYRRRSSFCQ